MAPGAHQAHHVLMPASAAARSSSASPRRRLVLLPREPRHPERTEVAPRRYRLAHLEADPVARSERFAHLKRSYD